MPTEALIKTYQQETQRGTAEATDAVHVHYSKKRKELDRSIMAVEKELVAERKAIDSYQSPSINELRQLRKHKLLAKALEEKIERGSA
ncbi:hypothetical protein [Bartonella sp. DGB2]|uniref:hypothetical protein n=1 Tax=Bartonella sp. DGB2 TaxID=3388426 RepID=UPI00398FD1D7